VSQIAKNAIPTHHNADRVCNESDTIETEEIDNQIVNSATNSISINNDVRFNIFTLFVVCW